MLKPTGPGETVTISGAVYVTDPGDSIRRANVRGRCRGAPLKNRSAELDLEASDEDMRRLRHAWYLGRHSTLVLEAVADRKGEGTGLTWWLSRARISRR